MSVSKDPAEVHAVIIARSVFQSVVMSLDEKVPEVPLAQLLEREWLLTRGWRGHEYPDQEGRKGDVLAAAATHLKAAVIKHYVSLQRIAQKEAAEGAQADPAALLSELDYLTYPPALYPAALRTDILARVAKRDEWDRVLESMTPDEAWDAFVGSQSTADFWALSYEKGVETYRGACREYTQAMPGMADEWADLTGTHQVRIAELLTRHLERNLGPIAGA